MEYVLLDMKWNMIISNKQLEFDVRQLAAIHVDEHVNGRTFYLVDNMMT